MINNNSNSQPERQEADDEEPGDYINPEIPNDKLHGENISIAGIGWSISLTSQRCTIVDLLNLFDRIHARYFSCANNSETKKKDYVQ